MHYTVKQLAGLAGVSNRTLHYYDEIGLLRPASVGGNGYRYYGEEAIFKLQQILFYRELGFTLGQIKAIIDRPDFDLLDALAQHRAALSAQIERTQVLIETIDHTMQHLKGEIKMAKQDFYKGFDEKKQKEYALEAEKLWGEPVTRSQKRWEESTREEKNAFLAEMHEISNGLAENMDKGYQSPAVQAWIGRWYRFIDQKCYPCSLDSFENLGHMYVEDERFKENYEKIRPGMAEFMDKSMTYYCSQNR